MIHPRNLPSYCSPSYRTHASRIDKKGRGALRKYNKVTSPGEAKFDFAEDCGATRKGGIFHNQWSRRGGGTLKRRRETLFHQDSCLVTVSRASDWSGNHPGTRVKTTTTAFPPSSHFGYRRSKLSLVKLVSMRLSPHHCATLPSGRR